jgi:hypothetical protein
VSAGGARGRRDQVPAQLGRTAPAVHLGVPALGSDLGGSFGPGSALAGCRE